MLNSIKYISLLQSFGGNWQRTSRNLRKEFHPADTGQKPTSYILNYFVIPRFLGGGFLLTLRAVKLKLSPNEILCFCFFKTIKRQTQGVSEKMKTSERAQLSRNHTTLFWHVLKPQSGFGKPWACKIRRHLHALLRHYSFTECLHDLPTCLHVVRSHWDDITKLEHIFGAESWRMTIAGWSHRDSIVWL